MPLSNEKPVSSYKHSVLSTYDEVHQNFAYAYNTGTDTRTVDLSKIINSAVPEGTEPGNSQDQDDFTLEGG